MYRSVHNIKWCQSIIGWMDFFEFPLKTQIKKATTKAALLYKKLLPH